MAKKRTQARRKGSTSRSRSGSTGRARSGGRKSTRVKSGGKQQTVRIVIEQPYSPFGPAVAGASVTPAKARF